MIDGLKFDDPGWRLLDRHLAGVGAPRELWLHSGSPTRACEGVRTVLDVREFEAPATLAAVGPRIPGEDDPLGAQRFDVAAMWPRAHLGKDFTLACFGRAGLHLEVDGALFVCARKQKGAKSLAQSLERLFGDVETVARDRGYHLMRAERGVGFDEGLARTWADASYTVRDAALGELCFHTAPGVFSRRGLDVGTRALIEFVATDHGDVAPQRVLDLCGGVGTLGLWSAQRWPQAKVDIVESNLLASKLAERNAAANGLDSRVSVACADGLEASPAVFGGPARAQLALLNPPTHASEAASVALIQPLRAHLEPGAPAYVVVNRAGPWPKIFEDLGAKVHTTRVPGFAILDVRWAESQ